MLRRSCVGSVVVSLLTGYSAMSVADQTTPIRGIKDNSPSLIAFTNATIISEPGKVQDNAVLVIEKGLVKSITTANNIPAGAKVVDLTGHTVYPGFVDPYTNYGLPAVKSPAPSDKPIYDNVRQGGNATNGAVHASYRAVKSFAPDAKAAEDYRKNGFTSVQTARFDGIFRGIGAAVSLGDGVANDLILSGSTRQFMSFNKGTSQQAYPSSLMGSVALIRQTLSDANWYSSAYGKTDLRFQDQSIEYNGDLAVLRSIDDIGVIFDAGSQQSLLRADGLMDQFKVGAIQLASGYEYARLEDMKNTGANFIVPVNFPAAPEVGDIDDANDVNLSHLRHWERAPTNPVMLAKSGVSIAFTMHGLKKKDDFWSNVKKAVKHGLSKEDALRALTTVPANMSRSAHKVGRLEEGYRADFVVATGDLFDEGKIQSVWIGGQETSYMPLSKTEYQGDYTLNLSGKTYELSLTGDDKLKGKITLGEKSADLKNMQVSDTLLSFSVNLSELEQEGVHRAQLKKVTQGLKGQWLTDNGDSLNLTANTKVKEASSKEDKDESSNENDAVDIVSRLTYPNVAYGLESLPDSENLHIKNATIWTSDEQGVIQGGDIIVTNGKFAKVGMDLRTPRGHKVIDATGMHISPGIIDEHSHVAMTGGSNEATESNTAEVGTGDIINPNDIYIYRTLAGGTTMAQILHGSANPIGGKAQVVKWRWGDSADNMKFDKAPGTIKFALGENVKQSNWGEDFVTRYPQSRLGVETYIRDQFEAAKRYMQQMADYQKLSRSEKAKVAPPRKDYRLDTLVEILNSERFIHVHSYVQSEILALMRLAESMNFKINTYTHILEGYKVADEMAKHGASASTFADWWAYKYEVIDAIPQNMCIMQERGVVVSLNSDDRDLIRRLNQEAAKAMTYCDMSAEDALKMVTINPAKQLRIDNYVGSIKEGKDADFVIWNGSPVSTYSSVKQTWIDGRKYFDLDKDMQVRQSVSQEKNLLMQKVLQGGKLATQGDTSAYLPAQPQWHCEDHGDYWHFINGLQQGAH